MTLHEGGVRYEAFLNRIYKKIKWPLTEARWNYAEAKKLKTKWGVYKNIICFYRELCRHADAAEACYLMKKIIFIKKSYIRSASTTTMVYRDLQREFLSSDWAEYHKSYYQNILIKEMKHKYSFYTDTGINRKGYEILTSGKIKRACELMYDELQGLTDSTEDLSI